jgi:hypothetical protein
MNRVHFARYKVPAMTVAIPLLRVTNSSAATAMSKIDKQTSHIRCRWLYMRNVCHSGQIALYYMDGKTHADLGTKDVPANEAYKKIVHLDLSSTSTGDTRRLPTVCSQSSVSTEEG